MKDPFMNHNNAVAFSLVIVAGAILAGCGVIAGAIGAPQDAVSAIAAGCVVGAGGFMALWAECTDNWGWVKNQLPPFMKKPAAKQPQE